MTDELRLILHNGAGIFSALVVLILGVFVLLKDYRKTVNLTLGLTFLGAIVALVANVIGVSVSDPALSRSILMWNLSIIGIAAVNFHCVAAILNEDVRRRGQIIAVYAISAAFLAVFLAFPDTFLLDSKPKMYFPNYYVPGSLHIVFNIIFKLTIPFYFIFQLA